MKQPLQFFFRFTKDQRKGVVALFVLIFIFQAGYFVFTSFNFRRDKQTSEEEKEWLSLQADIDALRLRKGEAGNTIYPFNPNYISDYKGYTLGMTTAEIDRLHAFRNTGKFINTAQEFKTITKVPDSTYNRIAPYFKFPHFKDKDSNGEYVFDNKEKSVAIKNTKPEIILDINNAVEEDLVKVYGIGPYYAKAILRRRAQLGGFVSMEQMADFEDLSTEAIAGLKKRFEVNSIPKVSKININDASLSQLSYFPYFNRGIAKSILTMRSMDGKISGIEELLEINGFPVDKHKIIALYLDF
jgi:DNA uptake protein ComE-like DNA-binding protein